MITPKALEESVTKQEDKLQFNGAANDGLPEENKRDAMIANLKKDLDITEEELKAMLSTGHYNHQY